MNFLFPEDKFCFSISQHNKIIRGNTVTHLQTGKIQGCQSLAPLKVVHPHMNIRISCSPENIEILFNGSLLTMLLEEKSGWLEQGLERNPWIDDDIKNYFRKYQKHLVEIMEDYIHRIRSQILEIAKIGFIVQTIRTEMANPNVGRKLMIWKLQK